MIWPAPPHRGQGWLIEKNPWLWASMPRPSQRGQVIGPVPGLAPLPLQVGQRPAFGTVTLIWVPLTAWSKPSWTSVSRSRPRTCCGWARRGEDVAVVGAAEPAGLGAAAERPGPLATEPAERPTRVVLLALLGIGEDVVGGGDLLELFLRRGVVGVAVRVVFARQLPVRLLDLLV
jgi:hypothetical protein